MLDNLRGMNPNRRVALLAAVLGLVVIALFFGKWATAPQFVPLFRGIDLREVGAAAAALDKAGIASRLADGGSSIEVPVRDAARARVALAQQNLPASGRPGLELFDRPTWGMTDFTQRVTYRRALEGELARTIGSLKGVQQAQVHLALPESSPLRRLERAAEAAVVLTLGPDAAVGPAMVQGIIHLVSSSVENLSSERVAVIDNAGRLLSTPDEGSGGAGLTGRQLGVQQEIEQHLARKVEQLLGTVTGPSQLRVQVAARLNFAQVDRTVEQYDPDGQVLANEQRSEGGAGGESDAGATVMNNTYLNSRKIEKLVGEVGNITRLTVSVMVNSRGLSADGGDPEAQRLRLVELAGNAVGIDSARGDQLSVVAVPFGEAPVLPVPESQGEVTSRDPLELIERLGGPALGLLAVLAAFLLGWRALKPAGRPVAALPESADASELPSGALQAALPSPDQVQLRKRLQSDLGRTPDAAAKVVRTWLMDAS